MNKEEILNTIKMLSNSQGFYGRLYRAISDNSEEAEEFLAELESMHFKDAVDLIMYIEG